MTRFHRHTFFAIALAILGAFSVSCTRVYPVRTLPNWVRGIYIPMVMNKSKEPGIEEIATRMAQEEFLADGQIRIVPKSQADLQLVAVIKSYTILSDDSSSGGDRISNRDEIIIASELKLYDPSVDPFKPDQEPIANLGEMRTRFQISSDTRQRNYIPEPDAKEDLFGAWARQVVSRTITGFPVELQGLPQGTQMQQMRQPDHGIQGDVFRNKTSGFR